MTGGVVLPQPGGETLAVREEPADARRSLAEAAERTDG
jgi:hypothetical protein